MSKNYNKGKIIGMNQGKQNTSTKIGSQPNININPKDLTDVVCEKCGCQAFEMVFLFKKLSAGMSPSGKDTMIPLQTYRCIDCKHTNKEFLPKDKPDA